MIRLAVASDLHAATKPKRTSNIQETFLHIAAPEVPASHDAAHSLHELIRAQPLSADALLVGGDLTNRADPDGLVWADLVTQKIAASLNARCLTTIGNHDVDSRGGSSDPFGSAKYARKDFPTGEDTTATSFWSHHYFIQDFDTWRVIVLNTAFEHTNKIAAERGSVAPQTLDAVEAEIEARGKMPIQVTLMHHHPIVHSDIGMTQNDIMLNGDQVLETLARCGVGLIVHGHKHRPRITQHLVAGHSIAILAAGSFSAALPPTLGSNVRNVFHIIEIDDPGENRIHVGTVRTWQYSFAVGWHPATNESAGFPHLTGFGATESAHSIAAEVSVNYGNEPEPWDRVVSRVPSIKHIGPEALSALIKELEQRGFKILSTLETHTPELLYRPRT